MSRSLYLGRSGLGKTTLMVKKLEEAYNYAGRRKFYTILISPTARYQELYMEHKNYFDFFFEDLDETVTQKLQSITEKNSRKSPKKQKKLIIIIDDLGENTYMKYNKKNNALNTLVVSARHLKCHLIFLFQKLVQATTTLRRNVDYIYCFKLVDSNERNEFWKEFCGDLPEQVFSRLSNKAWDEKYGYLKIDRTDPVKGTKYYIKEAEENINKNKL